MESRENTPPPPGLQKWQDELDTDLPDDIPEEFEASLRTKYDFRIAARQNQTTDLTWVDQDESGTYDPDRKRAQALLPPVTKRRRERAEQVDDEAPKKPKTNTWLTGRRLGQQLRVTLKSTSEQGQAWLKSIGAALDNWPQPQLCDENSIENSAHWSDTTDTPPLDSNTFGQAPYKLRQRNKGDIRKLSTWNGCAVPDLANITLGHPAARGCKACLALGDRCPLLDEGSKYPCYECREADIDCELVIEPTKKDRCAVCSKGRKLCSYTQEGSDYTMPCDHCIAHSLKCVAGPKGGRTRTGPSYNQGLVSEERTTNRTRSTMRSCTQCSQAKKWCSLKNKNPKVPCKYCRENEMPCTYEPLNRRIAESRRIKEKTAELVQQQKPCEGKTSDLKKTDRCKAIDTKLAHPISFNYEHVEGDPLPFCHWCDDLLYGLLGLREIEVEVFDPGNGKGYIEVDDGHVSAGFPPSRMCDFCTMDRIKVLSCKIHQIEPLEDMDPDKFDFGSINSWIEPGRASSAPFAWCSICPAPAFFACCAMDEIGGEGEDIGGEGGKGCGLLLCESCAVTMVNGHDGDLEGLIDKLKIEEGDGGFGLRADADFLHPQGELMRRLGGT